MFCQLVSSNKQWLALFVIILWGFHRVALNHCEKKFLILEIKISYSAKKKQLRIMSRFRVQAAATTNETPTPLKSPATSSLSGPKTFTVIHFFRYRLDKTSFGKTRPRKFHVLPILVGRLVFSMKVPSKKMENLIVKQKICQICSPFFPGVSRDHVLFEWPLTLETPLALSRSSRTRVLFLFSICSFNVKRVELVITNFYFNYIKKILQYGQFHGQYLSILCLNYIFESL